jgi:type IV secretory pathway VirB10-like protein
MKSNQRGGVISFVIVALALTGLLAGGLYLSKNQGRVARDTDTSTPQISPVKKDETSKKTEEKTPEETKPATTTPAPTTPTNRVANTGPSEALPVTGPGDVAIITLGLGTLAFTGFRLVQSRRSVHHAALRR